MAGGVSLQGLSWGDQNNITRWIAMGGGGGGGRYHTTIDSVTVHII